MFRTDAITPKSDDKLRMKKLMLVLHFIRHLGKRVYHDDITALASHLAYACW